MHFPPNSVSLIHTYFHVIHFSVHIYTFKYKRLIERKLTTLYTQVQAILDIEGLTHAIQNGMLAKAARLAKEVVKLNYPKKASPLQNKYFEKKIPYKFRESRVFDDKIAKNEKQASS